MEDFIFWEGRAGDAMILLNKHSKSGAVRVHVMRLDRDPNTLQLTLHMCYSVASKVGADGKQKGLFSTNDR